MKTIKKGFCGLLAFVLLVLTVSKIAYADENMSGYISIWTHGEQKYYTSILNGNEIYLSTTNIAEISDYECVLDDEICFEKEGGLDSLTVLYIDFDGNVQTMGKSFHVKVLQKNEEYYLPLEKMLYLLHAQWCKEDGMIVVQSLAPNIIDFLQSNYIDMFTNKVNQTDLLINGENELAHNFRTSLAAVFNDFDPTIFIMWSSKDDFVPRLNKEYKEALLQLSSDDKTFIDDYGQSVIEKSLEKSDYKQLKKDWDNLQEIKSLPQNISNLSEAVKDTPSFKFNQYHNLKNIDIKEFSVYADEIDAISDTADVLMLVLDGIEVYQRSKEWGPGYIEQLKILTDFDDMGYNKVVTDRIKTAGDLVEEYEAPAAAASKSMALESKALLASYMFNQTVPGKMMSIFNAGFTIAKTVNEEWKKDVDAADLAYMVDCLIKTDEVAYQELSREYSKLLGCMTGGKYSEKDLKRLRNCLMLAIRADIRSESYVYYLNEKLNDNQNWKDTDEAKKVKENIANKYAWLCLIMETEPYDRLILLNDFKNMYSNEYGKMRQVINADVFHVGEIPEKDLGKTNCTLEEGIYSYSKGESLSSLRVVIENGEKKCYWGTWYNYGDAASLEDFEFIWKDGQYDYDVIGWRSRELMNVNVELKERSIILDIAYIGNEMYFEQGESNRFKAEYKLEEQCQINERGINGDRAIALAKEKLGDDFSYFCAEDFIYQGKEYFVVDVKTRVENHLTRVTQVLVAKDESYVGEGFYSNNGASEQIEFYE